MAHNIGGEIVDGGNRRHVDDLPFRSDSPHFVAAGLAAAVTGSVVAVIAFFTAFPHAITTDLCECGSGTAFHRKIYEEPENCVFHTGRGSYR